jgi:hypothetical protein
MLLLCLASVVWHSDFVKETAAADSEHPFNTLPLLSNPELLKDLKELVTLEPIGHVKQATGIPPHVQHAKIAREILALCVKTLEEVRQMAETVKESVKEAFEEKAEENGQVTGERLKQMFESHQQSMVQMIGEKLTELRNEIKEHSLIGVATQEQDDDTADDSVIPFADGDEDNDAQERHKRYRVYLHGGRHWHVPADFSFPMEVNLETGWRMWVQGMPGNETVDSDGNRQQAPIRPFRKLKLDMLPKDVKQKLQLHWRPIFSIMEQAPSQRVDPSVTSVDNNLLRALYDNGREYLKTRVSYVFENPKLKPMQWRVSTWSKKVARSSILKNGTEQDKANLPPEQSHRNKPRQQHGRTKPQADRRKVRRRVNHASGRAASAQANIDDDDNDEGQLPDLRDSLTPAAIARGREIEEQVAAETAAIIQEEQNEARRIRRIGIPAGDGTTLHVGPRFPLQDRRSER